ncbi:glycosyltransferase 25 family protein [Hydrogenophaga sp. RAC07]|uniref:glycosyltransferase family 25 protein n=1 Tax=Hydrogenophaga sp. RAC07 TaxID=1842537 RepID=UPI0008567599|nr:glycosyltransferase family 25 protein [Hydrogenophaga sp. RAC07]AOF84561.1 glycosyltransferase 25 family protein [Hydrogenophaga sp. RAC07]
MNHQAIPIFVISLERAPERRHAITSHLDSLGLEYEVVNAVDGKKLSEEEIAEVVCEGLSYDCGVVGCYLSHIMVYKIIVEKNIATALILEDDAILNPAMVEMLRGGLSYVEFDYCLLDCDNMSERSAVFFDPDSKKMLAPGFPIYETNIGPSLLHAYLMTNTGARKRLECAFPIIKPVDIYSHLPVDLRILVCVDPKGASVSELSRHSFTSNRNDTSPLRFRRFRRSKVYFSFRGWLKFKPIKDYFIRRELLRTGMLTRNKHWRPMPEGRLIQ